MRAEHWRQVTEVAAAQAGLVTSAQLRLIGASPAAVNRAVREGALLPVRNRVYALAGVPDDPVRPARAVSLVAPHAVVSHRTAAWLHGLVLRPPRDVHVIAPPYSQLRLHGVTAVEAQLPGEDVASVDGIPVTTVARTLTDLLAVLPQDWVERLVHEAVMRRLCEYDDVRTAASRAPGDGGAVMLAMLGDANETTPLEAQWAHILRDAGLPPWESQVQVVVGAHVFVLDFAWPDAMVALEVNGFAAHRTRAAFDRDHNKVAALQAAGWSVVSATARTPPAPITTALHRLLAFSTAPPAVENAG